jgi:hypothetical protein
MERIKKKMDNEASLRFWESFPNSEDAKSNLILPSLGESWWEAEKELSPILLSVSKYNSKNMKVKK